MTEELEAKLPAVRLGRGKPPNLVQYLAAERELVELGDIDWQRVIPPKGHFDPRASPAAEIGHIQRLMGKCPSWNVLTELIEVMNAALAEKPMQSVTSAAVALLFNSRVRQPANQKTYLEALIYDLMDLGYQPAVVVAACQKLRREQVHTPEIAEVLTACKAVRGQYRVALYWAREAVKAIEENERLLTQYRERLAAEPEQRARAASPGSLDW